MAPFYRRSMPLAQTPRRVHNNDGTISGPVAEQYRAALAGVQDLLAAKGFRTRWVKRISLRLYGSSGIRDLGVRSPELMVFAPQGRKVAEVTMGARSGAYLVSVPASGVFLRQIPADRPELVATLIPESWDEVT